MGREGAAVSGGGAGGGRGGAGGAGQRGRGAQRSGAERSGGRGLPRGKKQTRRRVPTLVLLRSYSGPAPGLLGPTPGLLRSCSGPAWSHSGPAPVLLSPAWSCLVLLWSCLVLLQSYSGPTLVTRVWSCLVLLQSYSGPTLVLPIRGSRTSIHGDPHRFTPIHGPRHRSTPIHGPRHRSTPIRTDPDRSSPAYHTPFLRPTFPDFPKRLARRVSPFPHTRQSSRPSATMSYSAPAWSYSGPTPVLLGHATSHATSTGRDWFGVSSAAMHHSGSLSPLVPKKIVWLSCNSRSHRILTMSSSGS